MIEILKLGNNRLTNLDAELDPRRFFEGYGTLRLRTTKMPFLLSISSSMASLGLKGYCESKTMSAGIVMYCVFAPGFFNTLPFALSTNSFPHGIHVRGI